MVPLSPSRVFARDKAVADSALRKAQQRVTGLAAIALNFQSPPLDQTSGPALKVPPPPGVSIPATMVSVPAGYKIPKKADVPVASVDLSKHVAKHHSRSSGKHSKTSRGHKKQPKVPRSSGKPKKDSPSDSVSSLPSESSSSDVEVPKVDDETAHVLCSVCCKYTAQPVFVLLGCCVFQVKGQWHYPY